MITPDLGNGVGFIYIWVFPQAVAVLPNTPASYASLGSAYVTYPKALFGVYASLAAPTAPTQMPEAATEIELEDLQTAAQENLLGITPP